MKHFFFSLIALFLFSRVEAQQNNGTKDDGFLLKLFLPDGSKPLFENKNGGYGYAAFGGEVLQEMEGEVAWVHTAIMSDSLGCDSIVNDLGGKFALVRRGNCELASKCYRAQLAGAKAVIVVNHYSGVFDDENTILNMGLGATIDVPYLQIPCISVCRKVGEMITDVIDNGQPLKARFVFRSLDRATVAYHYATPLSQVDTLKHITVHFFNPTSDTLYDVTVNAKITEPGGNVVNLSIPVASLAPKQDTLLFFPPYLPPSELGNFDVVFSNTAFGDSEDTLKQRFQITKHTWACDNEKIVPGGIPWNFQSVDPPPDYFQPGALYRTGPNGGKIAYATFGLVGADTLIAWDADFSVGVLLYDADANDDGVIDFSNDNWSDWQELTLIGWGSYKLTGNEADDELVSTPIKSLSPGVDTIFLKSRHWYYLCLLHSPDFGVSLAPPRFSITEKVHYFDFPSAPYQLYTLFFPKGFSDYTIVQRLSSENVIETKATSPLLAPSKFTLSPNPAADFLQLDLDLFAANKKVAASLLDGWGRVVVSEKRADFQEGVISFDVKNLPSGAYLLWLRTEEGYAMRKVMICH